MTQNTNVSGFIIAILVISLISVSFQELNETFAIVTYDNKAISGGPAILFDLPNEWWIPNSLSYGEDNSANYTYIFNALDDFQTIRISPDPADYNIYLNDKPFNEIAEMVVVTIANTNGYQIDHQNYNLIATNHTINNKTSYSYLATEINGEGNEVLHRIFVLSNADDEIITVQYSDSKSKFNTPESQRIMNDFVKSVRDKPAK